MDLPFPKPNTKRERAAKRNRVKDKRRTFQEMVVQMDGECMNPYCTSVHKHRRDYLHAHHIIPKSQMGPDEPANGISFCSICHPEYPHNGWRHPKTGDRLTGHQFVFYCIARHLFTSRFRWMEAAKWLQARIEGAP